MTEFMKWLRVELLRLRSFDWNSGSWRTRWLKDGVAQFTSIYPTGALAAKIGVSEEVILAAIDSPPVRTELMGKSFILGWKDDFITLSWLEEGISEWKMDVDQRYYEEDGKFYSGFRLTQKIVYLDGTERVVSDTGEPKRICITEEAFKNAIEWMRKNNVSQE